MWMGGSAKYTEYLLELLERKFHVQYLYHLFGFVKNSVYLFFFPFNLSKYVQHTRRLRIKWTAYAFSIEYCAFQLYVLLHCSVIIKRRLKVTAYLRGFLLSSGYIFITVLNQILSYTDITISSVNNLFSLNISKKIRSVNNGIIKIHQYPSIWPEC